MTSSQSISVCKHTSFAAAPSAVCSSLVSAGGAPRSTFTTYREALQGQFNISETQNTRDTTFRLLVLRYFILNPGNRLLSHCRCLRIVESLNTYGQIRNKTMCKVSLIPYCPKYNTHQNIFKTFQPHLTIIFFILHILSSHVLVLILSCYVLYPPFAPIFCLYQLPIFPTWDQQG